ncbi:hypothetical protein LFM09_28385 [Lentzea alba]|uniref:hypothetical protein n=1 Tax=Lentzea alba TaxID=2714351 RepID=UPI0039BEE0D7
MRRSVLVLSAVLALGVVTPAHAGPGLVKLGPLPGDLGSRPVALNDAGEAAGVSVGSGAQHAVRWSRDGKVTQLPDLGSGDSSVSDLNNSGTVVGGAGGRAVQWDGDQVTVLATPPGVTATRAWAISETGVVVGDAVVGQERRAVKWVGNKLTVLATLPGAWTINASQVNDRGFIAGTATFADNSVHVVRWDPRGRVSDLGTFGGFTEVRAINASGVVVGSSVEPVTTQTRAFRSNGGRIEALNGGDAHAYDINDFGYVVGDVETKQPRRVPAAWEADGASVPLQEAPGTDERASRVWSVNNAGVAVGESRGVPVRWVEGDTKPVVLPGGSGSAVQVNRSGLIAGTVQEGGYPQAVLWR